MHVLLPQPASKDDSTDLAIVLFAILATVIFSSITLYIIIIKLYTTIAERHNGETNRLLEKESKSIDVEKNLSGVKESWIVPQTANAEFAAQKTKIGRTNTQLQPTTARETVLVHSTGDIRSTSGQLTHGRTDNRIPVVNGSESSVGVGGRLASGQGHRMVNTRRIGRRSADLNRVTTSFTSLTETNRDMTRNGFNSALNRTTTSRLATTTTTTATSTGTPAIHVMVPRVSDSRSQTVSYGTAMAQLHGIHPGTHSTTALNTERTTATRGLARTGAATPPSPTDSVAITSHSLLSTSVTREPRTSYDPNLNTHIYRTHSPYERINEGRKRRPLGGVSSMSTHSNDDCNSHRLPSNSRIAIGREIMSEERPPRDSRSRVSRLQDPRSNHNIRSQSARVPLTPGVHGRTGQGQDLRAPRTDNRPENGTRESRDQPSQLERGRPSPESSPTNEAPILQRGSTDEGSRRNMISNNTSANRITDTVAGTSTNEHVGSRSVQAASTQATKDSGSRGQHSSSGHDTSDSLEAVRGNKRTTAWVETIRSAKQTSADSDAQPGTSTSSARKKPVKNSSNSTRESSTASKIGKKTVITKSEKKGTQDSSSNSVEHRTTTRVKNTNSITDIILSPTASTYTSDGMYGRPKDETHEILEAPGVTMPGLRVGTLPRGRTLDNVISINSARRAAGILAESEGTGTRMDLNGYPGINRHVVVNDRSNSGKGKENRQSKKNDSTGNSSEEPLSRRTLPLKIPVVEPLVKLNQMDKRLTEIAQIRDFIMRELSSQFENEDDMDSEDCEDSLEGVVSMRGKP